MMKRPRLTASSSDHPAVRRYLRDGHYPVRGVDRHFSWDVWTHPERQRTPQAEAERVTAFISSLTHSKGPAARQPFRLRSWQAAIIRPLFSTLDADGYPDRVRVPADATRQDGAGGGAHVVHALWRSGRRRRIVLRGGGHRSGRARLQRRAIDGPARSRATGTA